tara:strand:- start:1290 stop:1694 length:405 start_codon:yes stop_codon:yes gene_type:complete
MTFDEKFYVLRVHSHIKNVSKFLDKNFIKELKNSDGTLKPHISDLNNTVTYYGKPCIKCTIPTLFIEIEYKTSDGLYLIEHDVFLYDDDYPTLKDLEAYKDKLSYGFASQVTQEIKDIVEAFHNGYGCMCLSEV